MRKSAERPGERRFPKPPKGVTAEGVASGSACESCQGEMHRAQTQCRQTDQNAEEQTGKPADREPNPGGEA